VDDGNTLRPTGDPLAHYLPTDNRKATPDDLAEVTAAWPELPEAIKAGILALVRAAQGVGR
jgi:hypothetical protein